MLPEQFIVDTLGNCNVDSPLLLSNSHEDTPTYRFVGDDERVLYDTSIAHFRYCCQSGATPVSFEKAGPKEKIYFQPAKTKVAIVTCGGLCPGINNVIRELVHQLYYRYGVTRTHGFLYGYEGLVSKYNHEVIDLTPQSVDYIHLQGGTILGSSRGQQNVSEMVDTLEMMNINILFCIGGDGTLRGAHAIHQEVERRGLKIVVAGVPKTIDNDIDLIQQTFGFETAVAEATKVIKSAHDEAKGAYNGVSLVKLMGRDSGFIAASAALAIQEANFVLVPEVPFELYGARGFLSLLKKRLEQRHHAVVVVAEGAGQNFFQTDEVIKDASGNIIHNDIGIFLKNKIKEFFDAEGLRHAIKYIDPSYIIRSVAATADDSKFCSLLAHNAVHAAMAGKTDFVIGFWNNQFTLMPISETIKQRKKIDVNGELWWNVLESTGQPENMTN